MFLSFESPRLSISFKERRNLAQRNTESGLQNFLFWNSYLPFPGKLWSSCSKHSRPYGAVILLKPPWLLCMSQQWVELKWNLNSALVPHDASGSPKSQESEGKQQHPSTEGFRGLLSMLDVVQCFSGYHQGKKSLLKLHWVFMESSCPQHCGIFLRKPLVIWSSLGNLDTGYHWSMLYCPYGLVEVLQMDIFNCSGTICVQHLACEPVSFSPMVT